MKLVAVAVARCALWRLTTAVALSCLAPACSTAVGPPPLPGLVGSWVASDVSLTLLKQHGFVRVSSSDHSIQLNRDGTCRFGTYWELSDSRSVPEGEAYVVSENCRWRVAATQVGIGNPRQVVGAVELDIEKAVTAGQEAHVVFATLIVREDQGGLRLVNRVGDPDREEFVEYQRVDRQR